MTTNRVASEVGVLRRVLLHLGLDLAGAVRDFLGSADPTTAASRLIGGLTASELPTGSVGGLRLEVGGPQGFLLPPLIREPI